ncbi:MAB_1171c family putative transporter [Streptomyces sp. NPDC000594]|uniref:MAB_1171c family putative transporter n=1 Tax=Streptomyces sp. NPDC000594 TaxID=3154261 RepID=UPI0033341FF7
MRNSDYYVPAVALFIALVAKVPALRRDRRDPLVRSVLFLLVTAALCFLFAAPPTIVRVNSLFGVPNLSAPLVYCIMSAFSCACMVLIVNWRGGPRERVRCASLAWITLYGMVIVALPVLFALGDTPVERLRDFDTYYATTPYIREMVVLYLLANAVSAVVTTVMCLRWARAVGGWLRLGLLVLVVGLVLNLAFGSAKLTAVAARWAGAEYDGLSTTVAPPLAAVGGLTLTAGFLLPLVGPRLDGLWQSWRMYTRLGTLWRQLRPGAGEWRPPVPSIPWWAPAELRLTVRETLIHDELLRLQPYLDDRVRHRAYEAALGVGASERRARTAGVAAMVAAAVESRRAGREPAEEEEHARAGTETLRAALGRGRERLVRLSTALHGHFPPERRGPGRRMARRTSAGRDRRAESPAAGGPSPVVSPVPSQNAETRTR